MNTTNRTMRHAAAAALLLVTASSTRAEDIDIFSRVSPQNDLPSVILMWDSSANWGANMPGDNCYYLDGTGGPKASAAMAAQKPVVLPKMLTQEWITASSGIFW